MKFTTVLNHRKKVLTLRRPRRGRRHRRRRIIALRRPRQPPPKRRNFAATMTNFGLLCLRKDSGGTPGTFRFEIERDRRDCPLSWCRPAGSSVQRRKASQTSPRSSLVAPGRHSLRLQHPRHGSPPSRLGPQRHQVRLRRRNLRSALRTQRRPHRGKPERPRRRHQCAVRHHLHLRKPGPALTAEPRRPLRRPAHSAPNRSCARRGRSSRQARLNLPAPHRRRRPEVTASVTTEEGSHLRCDPSRSCPVAS